MCLRFEIISRIVFFKDFLGSANEMKVFSLRHSWQDPVFLHPVVGGGRRHDGSVGGDRQVLICIDVYNIYIV